MRCFLFLLPNYINFLCIIMQWFLYLDKEEVLQQEYPQPPLLPSPHFRWVVNRSPLSGIMQELYFVFNKMGVLKVKCNAADACV